MLTDFLNLPGYKVIPWLSFELDDRFLIKVELTEKCFVCPICGRILPVSGSYPRTFIDAPRDGKAVYVSLTVPRRKCDNCNVGFVDPLPGQSRNHRMAQRAIDEREKKFHFRVPDVHIGLDPGASLRTIGRVRREWQDKMEVEWRPDCPRYMTIDEIYPEGKKKRKTTGKRKGYCVISNDELGRVIGFLPSLMKTEIARFLRSLPHPENLIAVSMDLTNHLDEVVRSVFPKIPIVRDESHVHKEAREQFDRTRKLIGNAYMCEMTSEKYAEYVELTKSGEFEGEEPKVNEARRKIRNSLNRKAKLFTTPYRNLSDKNKKIVRAWFATFPELHPSYAFLQALFSLYKRAIKSEEAEKVYDCIQLKLGDGDKTLWEDFFKTIARVKKEVLAFFDSRMTTARAETLNGMVCGIISTSRGMHWKTVRAKVLFGEAPSYQVEMRDRRVKAKLYPPKPQTSPPPKPKIRKGKEKTRNSGTIGPLFVGLAPGYLLTF